MEGVFIRGMDTSNFLQLAIVSVVSVLVFFVIERCVHVFLTLFASVIFSSESTATYPAMQAIGAMFSVVTSMLFSVMGSIGQLFSSVLSIFMWWLVLFLCACVFFLVY